jgi:hypothetical protein
LAFFIEAKNFFFIEFGNLILAESFVQNSMYRGAMEPT